MTRMALLSVTRMAVVLGGGGVGLVCPGHGAGQQRGPTGGAEPGTAEAAQIRVTGGTTP